MKLIHRSITATALVVLSAFLSSDTAHAWGRGRVSVSRSFNVHGNFNRNVNIHRDVDINRHVDIDVDHHYHGGRFAAGMAVGTITGLAIGAAVAAPPRGYVPVYVGANPYYYYGGVYYQPASTGYVVVAPPVGVIVPNLPPGSTSMVVNGVTHFVFNGTHYLPVMVNGVTEYQVVAV